MKTYLDHAAVTVADIEWTKKLFEEVLGMRETRRKEQDGRLTMLWLDGGIQLVAAPAGSAAGRGHHLGLVVDDRAAALRALLAVPGVHGIAGKPEKWVQLPDGLTLEMFQAKAGAIDAALGNPLK
ncbi:MAG: VOC family protein [Selenomonadaceae bacterium]|nr:VOC family protein [Selenomonadaceae bacterium]